MKEKREACCSIVSMPEFALPSLSRDRGSGVITQYTSRSLASSRDNGNSYHSSNSNNPLTTPCFRFSEMPVRRHVQNEDTLLIDKYNNNVTPATTSMTLNSYRSPLATSDTVQSLLPTESLQLLHWYINSWDGANKP